MYKISVWQAADVPVLAALERECFPDPWSETELLKQFSRDNYYGFVIKAEDTIVGFIYGSVLFEDAEIYKVAVHPSWRCKGLGQRLVDEATAYFKNQSVERVFLEVRAGNAAARGLYEKNGFSVLRIHSKYYADGEDAVEMKKDL
jgi:ribosomal-protein-alanine N-acetyltransferase